MLAVVFNSEHKIASPTVIFTTDTDEYLVLKYQDESDYAVVKITIARGVKFRIKYYCHILKNLVIWCTIDRYI